MMEGYNYFNDFMAKAERNISIVYYTDKILGGHFKENCFLVNGTASNDWRKDAMRDIQHVSIFVGKVATWFNYFETEFRYANAIDMMVDYSKGATWLKSHIDVATFGTSPRL